MNHRSTGDVFVDHLRLAAAGDVETDVARNFAEDCVLLTSYGNFRGHEGVRAAAALLDRQLGPSTYEYRNTVWDGDVAFLEWAADTPRATIRDGADSFVIRDGLIRTMTIHYTVEEKPAALGPGVDR